MKSLFTLLTAALAAAIGVGHAQQVADLDFLPDITSPAYPKGKGPVVVIDEAHQNFHTADGRYKAFAELLRKDGYQVKASDSLFSLDSLNDVNILVIANAMDKKNRKDWKLPASSAFTKTEIQAVQQWVHGGGALFLTADHMPFPGAAAELAEAFGLLFSNGFALFPKARTGLIVFQSSDGSLADHPVCKGREPEEKIDRVTSFTGQAFRLKPGIEAQPLLVLKSRIVLFLPIEAWRFTEQTPFISAEGMLQGALLRHGKGRVAAFGEAAMFTAQVAGPERKPMGMNHPRAPQNVQFLLNVVHWLSGLLTE